MAAAGGTIIDKRSRYLVAVVINLRLLRSSIWAAVSSSLPDRSTAPSLGPSGVRFPASSVPKMHLSETTKRLISTTAARRGASSIHFRKWTRVVKTSRFRPAAPFQTAA